MKINDKEKLTPYITLKFESASPLNTESFATILKAKQKKQINLNLSEFSKENYKNYANEKKTNTLDNKQKEEKLQNKDQEKILRSEEKKRDKEKKTEKLFPAIPNNLLINLQNVQTLLVLLKQKIAEIIESTNSDFEEKIYNFKLDSDTILPLELAIKKIDGKYSIKLYANGILKEEILNNLDQLAAYLKQRGFNILNLQIAELPKKENDKKDERQKKRQMLQNLQDDNIIIGENEETLKTGIE